MKHLELTKKLCSFGFECYTVGGSVRDIFLNSPSNDFDLVTNATPDQIENIFKNHNVKTVGKSFGVVLVDDIEIATYRTDVYNGLNDKDCKIEFVSSIEEDLSRRDLTINAMAFCEKTGKVIDLFDGLDDVKNKIIKFVGDPEKRILEDPNRIIRACRFLSSIEGKFDIDTIKALQKNSHLIKTHVAPERIRIEIMKAMKHKNPSLFFQALWFIDGLKYIFPSLDKCFDHDHGTHHIETVWDHNMIAGDSVSSKFPLIRLAAFLHDCGKPESFNKEEGTFYQHQYIGERNVKNDLKKLKFTNDEIDLISGLIRLHMHSISDSATDKSFRRIYKKLNESKIPVNDFIRIKLADRKGNVKRNPFSFKEIKNMKSRFTTCFNDNTPFNVTNLALSGGDVIEIFKLKPGPIIGKIQKSMLDFVIDNGTEFNNAIFLIEFVDEFIQGDLS